MVPVITRVNTFIVVPVKSAVEASVTVAIPVAVKIAIPVSVPPAVEIAIAIAVVITAVLACVTTLSPHHGTIAIDSATISARFTTFGTDVSALPVHAGSFGLGFDADDITLSFDPHIIALAFGTRCLGRRHIGWRFVDSGSAILLTLGAALGAFLRCPVSACRLPFRSSIFVLETRIV